MTVGTNELVGTDPANLGPALARLMVGQWKRGGAGEVGWQGGGADRGGVGAVVGMSWVTK